MPTPRPAPTREAEARSIGALLHEMREVAALRAALIRQAAFHPQPRERPGLRRGIA
ncbi:MAG: hypothetical protein V4574_21615 [Pseudomonadota bacterium]